MIYLDLILNLSLLVSLSIISGFIEARWPRYSRQGQLLQGLLFGSAAVIGMLRPLVFGPGLIFDGRSIMISLCALFFGPWAAAPAGVMTIICRIGLGGSGTIMGVLVILASAAIGLLAHFRFRPELKPPSIGRLYLFGLVVHLVMIALMFTLPGGTGLQVVRQLGLPILFLYPLATILTGKILVDQVATTRAVTNLQKSETRFRTLFERHQAVKLIIDPETSEIIDANQAAADYYGWSRKQLRQMKISDINTLSPEEIQTKIADARSGKKVHFEVQHRRADGSIRDVAIFSSTIILNGRELLHSIVHDITEQKQAEQRLLEQDAKYRDLIENAPIGIFSTTSQGQPLSLNTTMARILDVDSVQEAMEQYTDLETQLYASSEQRDQFIQMLKKDGRVENFEYRAKTAKGRLIWLNATARIAEQHEDGSFIIEGFTTDISERRKLEDQFRQAQKMESIGQLAGGVAHDYNNMLSVIHGYAELALNKVDPATSLYNDLQEIIKAAKHSTEITRQLLTFARQQTVAPKVIDLNAEVAGMLKMLHRLIGEDINLVSIPGAKVWPVKIDPSQVDQLLANLCVNARDSITGCGRITIETENVTFSKDYCSDHPGFIPGEYVRLVLSDNGSGMDKKTLDKIFEPFFTTKEIGHGTGLGLATIYGIMKQNSGFIYVYSEPGKGSSFHLYLPRHAEIVVEKEQISTTKVLSGSGEVILVVEDEISLLTLSQIILEDLGYVVLAAGTANEAMHLAEGHGGKIHLLITDVVMPEVNGKELAERLQSLYPKLKCLFMSGYTANVIALYGILDEGIHFIQKPFSRDDIATKIREVLEG
ncbi:MAG: PAS domain S-box protein [Proteobacteria bacterium]|jgi:PAS domain S-box-containing protein|nr:PAS domain S-box protein [Desulfocapsa sp.]MBU3943739.1 PAS domain S-box protein [Pseudomonadota bacterium]MCG2744833.1 PAS domain S-box protein [Desulfobacteraceae bacterium]MBU3982487.1 PAS domain S-box protein [Pseudomonadota bacterium]MBU4029275.1 PAS domain S-box protein [Pseudomonadota bacterium]